MPKHASLVATLQAYLNTGGDLLVIEIGWRLMVAIGAFVASLTVARIVVPHNRSIWQRCLLLPLPAKLGWFVQEAPALCVPLFLITSVGGRYIEKMNANSILLGMFLLHYVHR